MTPLVALLLTLAPVPPHPVQVGFEWEWAGRTCTVVSIDRNDLCRVSRPWDPTGPAHMSRHGIWEDVLRTRADRAIPLVRSAVAGVAATAWNPPFHYSLDWSLPPWKGWPVITQPRR